jgi:hypothetical protein
MDRLDRCCSGELAFPFRYEGDAVFPKECGDGDGGDGRDVLGGLICVLPPP